MNKLAELARVVQSIAEVNEDLHNAEAAQRIADSLDGVQTEGPHGVTTTQLAELARIIARCGSRTETDAHVLDAFANRIEASSGIVVNLEPGATPALYDESDEYASAPEPLRLWVHRGANENLIGLSSHGRHSQGYMGTITCQLLGIPIPPVNNTSHQIQQTVSGWEVVR